MQHISSLLCQEILIPTQYIYIYMVWQIMHTHVQLQDYTYSSFSQCK